MHITKWKSQSEKATWYRISITWYSGKSKTEETVKRYIVARGWTRGLQNKGFLGQWKYFLWYYNGRCAVLSCSVVSDSLWFHGPEATWPLSTGILQARILGWVAIPQTGNWTQVSHTAGAFFIIWATREAHNGRYMSLNFVHTHRLYYIKNKLYTMDFRLWWCVNRGSLAATKTRSGEGRWVEKDIPV